MRKIEPFISAVFVVCNCSNIIDKCFVRWFSPISGTVKNSLYVRLFIDYSKVTVLQRDGKESYLKESWKQLAKTTNPLYRCIIYLTRSHIS